MTEAVYIIIVIVGGLTTIVAIITFALMRMNGGKSNALNAEESQLMQELFHGFTEMEKRIESLETLLLERERKDGK